MSTLHHSPAPLAASSSQLATFTPIITCEHAGNQIPEKFNYLFDKHRDLLNTHRGWDPGALDVSMYLGEHMKVKVHYNVISRLLIELNRSLHHEELFSEFSKQLSEHEKEALINTLFIPYREKVEAGIKSAHQPVLHLSIHSFVPVLNNKIRELEIGLLFDPQRKSELDFCTSFQQKLSAQLPDLRIKFNEPYKGIDDGFTTYLRTKFTDEHYRGIEIELNQKMINTPDWQNVKSGIANVLRTFVH